MNPAGISPGGFFYREEKGEVRGERRRPNPLLVATNLCLLTLLRRSGYAKAKSFSESRGWVNLVKDKS
jgi:hypothetical protein